MLEITPLKFVTLFPGSKVPQRQQMQVSIVFHPNLLYSLKLIRQFETQRPVFREDC